MQSPRKIECCTELGRENPSDGEPAYPRARKLFRSDSFCNPLGGSMLFEPFSPSAVFHGTPVTLPALNLAAMHPAGGRNEGRNHDEEPRNSGFGDRTSQQRCIRTTTIRQPGLADSSTE